MIGLKDLHIVFDSDTNRAKLFDAAGALLLNGEMRNRTVNSGFGHWGRAPRGLFKLGAPVDLHEAPFGFHFTPLIDIGPLGPMRQFGRRGIGIHGGGSGLADPFAPEQGWVITEGCLRVQNSVNEKLVKHFRDVQSQGGTVWITVLGK